MVAAAGSLEMPTIGLQQLDQLATLHRVYCTHQPMFMPMAALRLSVRSNECRKVAESSSSLGEALQPLGSDDRRM